MVHLFSGSVGAVLRSQNARDSSQTRSGSGDGGYFDSVSSIGSLYFSSDRSDTRSFVGLNWWGVDDSCAVSAGPDLMFMPSQVSYVIFEGPLNASGTSDSRL